MMNDEYGIYTGFVAKKEICSESGIIALLGYPAKPPKTINYNYQYYNLIYINKWVKSQAAEEKRQEDGTIEKKMGREAIDLLAKLRKGDKDAIKRVKQNIKTSEKYQLDNFDLITWFLVN